MSGPRAIEGERKHPEKRHRGVPVAWALIFAVAELVPGGVRLQMRCVPRRARRTWELYGRGVDDAELVAALRRGDEAVFAELVDGWGPGMLRLARLYVPSHAVAQEVVQETWLAVLAGLARFEGRSSLRTWVFSILINRARSHARREGRALPFASLHERWQERSGEPAVPPERFQGRGDARPGWWASPPASWTDPHARLEARETRAVIEQAIEALPPRQKRVLVLRDVVGASAEEACELLGLGEANQRVLLHRARSKVRAALEEHLEAGT